jgi:hypothetical protein
VEEDLQRRNNEEQIEGRSRKPEQEMGEYHHKRLRAGYRGTVCVVSGSECAPFSLKRCRISKPSTTGDWGAVLEAMGAPITNHVADEHRALEGDNVRDACTVHVYPSATSPVWRQG